MAQKNGQEGRLHIIASISPQSDGWVEGPTIKDMLVSGFSWVRDKREEWEKELEELKLDPNTKITEEILNRVNEKRKKENKEPLELPVERWNFNFQRALMDGGLYKVGFGPTLPKNPKRGFEQGRSIVFFASERKMVGLYGCAEVGSWVVDEDFKGNVRAPINCCVRLESPLKMPQEIKLTRGLAYISDGEAQKLMKTMMEQQGSIKEKLQAIYEVIWPEGESPSHVVPTTSWSINDYLEAEVMHFTSEHVATFYASLKTKGFVILSGLSGAGKTKLAQLFAELVCPCEKRHGENGQNVRECTHLFLSVRPDWRDSKALLGYYNPLTGRYESTALLKFVLRAYQDYEQDQKKAFPYFLILDEMNLSHVEYYFADFLSVLESGRDGQGFSKEPLRLHSFKEPVDDQDGQKIPAELKLPPNLYIIGTVNIDETTYMFSPKVLDRAFTIEFMEVDLERYIAYKDQSPEKIREHKRIREQIRSTIVNDFSNGGKFCAMATDKKEILAALRELEQYKAELEELNRFLHTYSLHFGYRAVNEIALFIQNAKSLPEAIGKPLTELEALDYAVLMKILPKFHGPRHKLEMPLWHLFAWCSRKPPEQPGDLTPQLVWKSVAEKEKAPSHSDIATFLNTWKENTQKFRFPATARKALQMLRELYEVGFASFAQ